jgi:hypothetical protein
MNKRSKIVMFTVYLSLALVVTLAFLVHPISTPTRNQRRVIRLLAGARARMEGCCVSSVSLQNGVILLPDKPRASDGYVFTLRASGPRFDLYAVPEQYAVTGFRSFFVDQTGVIRSAIQRQATSDSPSIQNPAP